MCEQLAQGCYLKAQGRDSNPRPLSRESNALYYATTPHHTYSVAQNKPDYSTFQPSYENLHKITPLTLVAHRKMRRQKGNVH